MSFERDEEPTVAFTPTWDPVWEEEPAPRQPIGRQPSDAPLAPWAPSPGPERGHPDPPISALVPVSARGTTGTLDPLDPPESPLPIDEPIDEAIDEPRRVTTGSRPAVAAAQKPVSSRSATPVGRTRRLLSRFRSALVLAIVVLLSGIALALAFGVAVGAIGFVLKKTVGG